MAPTLKHTSTNTPTCETTAERIRALCARIQTLAQRNPSAYRELCEEAGLGVDVEDEARERWNDAHPDIDPAGEEAQDLAASEDINRYYPTEDEIDDMCLEDVDPLDIAMQNATYPEFASEEEIEAAELEALGDILEDLKTIIIDELNTRE